MKSSTEELEKALRSLRQALALPKNDITRDASIQRFEFTIELAWKTAKKIMGTSSTAAKMVVREMGQQDLISDVEKWLQFIDDRNLSSHTYREVVADQVYDAAVRFAPECEDLLEKLKKI